MYPLQKVKNHTIVDHEVLTQDFFHCVDIIKVQLILDASHRKRIRLAALVK